ncbi:phosphoenolpyruvate--protein phosphotransferase [Rhodovastum atsumiense]|uniref:phosphoenolpyruvate--protein phosphotransferase n=2 Tax=Rhodovastum atsumiense TaxID=504468 RepID=A0A5M6IUU5_9PROT|nr:phosphoenolpyruvate--protein phosphotransferase [Rhodovastum atsumiense]
MPEQAIKAPLAGWVTPLSELEDPVFAGLVLGDGVAIDPVESTLRAPCDGIVTMLHRAHHALTLRTADGADILMHIGLDTVALGGTGFTPHVAVGQQVRTGEALISFDVALLAGRAKSLVSPVIVTAGDRSFTVADRVLGREVTAGDILFTLIAATAAATAAPAPEAGAQVARDVVLRIPTGLHARPAGIVSAAARGYQAEIAIALRDARANARSAVSLMGLGAQAGDILTLTARGPDAAAAVEAIATLLAEGHEASGPAPSHAAPPAVAPPLAVPEPPVPSPAAPFEPGTEQALSGVPAVPGRAVGTAFPLRAERVEVEEHGAGPDTERQRLRQALTKSQGDLQAEIGRSPAGSQQGEILQAHLAFVEDPDLAEAADAAITAGKSAGFAWNGAIDRQIDVLRGLGIDRMAERTDDLRDVSRRVLQALSGKAQEAIVLPPRAVLLADDLLPSQLATLPATDIAGIALARGGRTSHVAIMAGSLGIPTLVAVGPGLARVPEGAPVILDAEAGTLRVFPAAGTLVQMEASVTAARERSAAQLRAAHEDCRLADGTRIEVVANLGGEADIPEALARGAEGCGLLRSEFLFLDRVTAPSEDVQHATYQRIADGLQGRPLIIRTLDAGADKQLPYLDLPHEENPALGLRGVRVGLWRPELLRAQFRAILRVRPPGQCRIMLPMIALLEEIRAARALFEEVRQELGHTDPVQLGIMVEVPSAALMATTLAAEADFFSIGSNDLTQYALAMDRVNPLLARQLDGLHPAVLRLIAMTCEGASRHARWVGVCGGIASVPRAAPVLVGLGVTELSATAAAIPAVKALLRGLTREDCVRVAQQALAQDSAEAVHRLLAQTWPEA